MWTARRSSRRVANGRQVMEIPCLEPLRADIGLTAAQLAGKDDALDKARKPLSGKAAAIHEIVAREAPYLHGR